jgi:hypothetical protein
MSKTKFLKTKHYDAARSKANKETSWNSQGRWISEDYRWCFARDYGEWRIVSHPYDVPGEETYLARISFLQQTGLSTSRFPSRKEAAAALSLVLAESVL